MARMSIYIVAYGVFVYRARALCITAGTQSSSVLLNHLHGLVQRGIGHRQQPGLSGVGESGVASTGAQGATDFREVARVGGTPSSVILGVLVAVVAALVIGLFLLLACPVQRGPARPGLQRSRDSPRKGRDGECSEAEEPEYATLPSSLAQSASTLHDAAGGSDREERSSMPSMVSMPSLPQAPLCPQLIVPATSSLRAVLPMLACRARQDVVLNICSVPDLGGRPLFRARVSETGPATGAAYTWSRSAGSTAWPSPRPPSCGPAQPPPRRTSPC